MSGALASRSVTIVGAGVAGLAAAVALSRRGAAVTLVERAPTLAPVGAGLQLSPNAMRVLDALGLGPAIDSVSLPSRAIRLREAGGSDVLRLDLARHRPGARFRLIHRARLIEVLEAAAQQAGVRIELGREVTAPADASSDARLVIGADGLRSRFRAALNGPAEPFFTGQTAWRAVIPDDDPTPESQIFMGPGRHLVSYPVSRGLRNVVAVLETPHWQDEDWSRPDDPDNLRAAFSGFGGPVPGWLGRVTGVHVWGLFRHPVAPCWHDGRRAILGDAAHPTLPFMAQGACMAIEDAWVLAACLDATADQGSALSRYERLRKPRATRLVRAADANARNYHLTGAARVAAHAALRLGGRLAPRLLLSRFDWIYDFNPLEGAP